MYDTRLEMASDWLWRVRQGYRKAGEPVVRPFTQQPEDVTSPIETELSEVIRGMNVYDSVRDIIRVDMRRIREHTVRLYKGLYPDWEQTMTEAKLKELEGSVMMMLHHIKVEGDAPYDLPQQEKD